MSVMAPHRFHRSVGTRSDKGERLGCFVLNGVDRQGTGRIGYHCSARQGLVAHDHFTAPPILLPVPCLCTPYRTFYPVQRQCISSVTQFLHWTEVTPTTFAGFTYSFEKPLPWKPYLHSLRIEQQSLRYRFHHSLGTKNDKGEGLGHSVRSKASDELKMPHFISDLQQDALASLHAVLPFHFRLSSTHYLP